MHLKENSSNRIENLNCRLSKVLISFSKTFFPDLVTEKIAAKLAINETIIYIAVYH